MGMGNRYSVLCTTAVISVFPDQLGNVRQRLVGKHHKIIIIIIIILE
jgi:hypothetical protein